MKILRVILGVSLGWFAATSLIGLTLAQTVGRGNHGSIGYLILAWYAGAAGVAIQLLFILALRARRRRSR